MSGYGAAPATFQIADRRVAHLLAMALAEFERRLAADGVREPTVARLAADLRAFADGGSEVVPSRDVAGSDRAAWLSVSAVVVRTATSEEYVRRLARRRWAPEGRAELHRGAWRIDPAAVDELEHERSAA